MNKGREMSIDAMKQALEALEMVTVDVKTTPNAYEANRQAITALRAAIKEAQEPVAWFTVDEINEWAAKYLDALAKHPDQEPRQWQGLTEAEKVNVALDCGCADVAWMDFADALETKLKEKNNG